MTPRLCPCGAPITKRSKTGQCRSCAARGKPSAHAWPEEEARRFARVYPKFGLKCLDQFPGRTKEALASKARQLGLKVERPAPAPRKPVNARDDYDRKQGRRYQKHRARNMEKARELVDQGVKPGQAKQIHMKLAMVAAAEQAAEERRRACPVEQAKVRLQRKGPVYSMAVIGGRKGFYFVHGRRDVPEQDLIEMAREIAA